MVRMRKKEKKVVGFLVFVVVWLFFAYVGKYTLDITGFSIIMFYGYFAARLAFFAEKVALRRL